MRWPLTLTMLSAVTPPERRGAVLGAWGGIGGLGAALGPLAGGALAGSVGWRAIFWLNVPLGLVLLPLGRFRLAESYGPRRGLDLAGVVLGSAGLSGIVWAVIRVGAAGWASAGVSLPLSGGVVLLVLFVLWEMRTPAPMLPMRFFRNRTFSGANVASLLMFFGMFGSVFLLAQFFQTVQGMSPLDAGLRILPWTAMPLLVAPTAGALSDRISGRTLLALGLALQGAGLLWIGLVLSAGTSYGAVIIPFVLSGVGMGLFFAPVANLVLSSVRREQEGKASGANNAIRELGGVLGVAVLASIFAHAGGYTSSAAFVAGLTPAIIVGAVVVFAGAVVAALIPGRRQAQVAMPQEALEAAAV